MSLKQSVRHTYEKGKQVHAIVEEVNLAFATVRLASNGQRLTNLIVQSENLKTGDKVLVIYSNQQRPFVIRDYFEPDDYALPLIEVETLGEPLDSTEMLIARLWNSNDIVLRRCPKISSLYEIQINSAVYDTGNFMSTRGAIINYPGRYLISWSMDIQTTPNEIGSYQYGYVYPCVILENGIFFFTSGVRAFRLERNYRVLSLSAAIPAIALYPGEIFTLRMDLPETVSILSTPQISPVINIWKIAEIESERTL